MENNQTCSREYTLLFNGITDTINQLESLLLRLKRMQAEAEDLYLSHEEETENPEA